MMCFGAFIFIADGLITLFLGFYFPKDASGRIDYTDSHLIPAVAVAVFLVGCFRLVRSHVRPELTGAPD